MKNIFILFILQFSALAFAANDSIEKSRALTKRPCDMIAAGEPRDNLRLLHEISHRIKLEDDMKRPGVKMMTIDDLPMPKGNVLAINFGYPHVSLFYGKVEGGAFHGDKFESWPLYTFKPGTSQKNALVLEAGVHYLAYDLPDELIASVSRAAQQKHGKLKLSCAAGVCEVLRKAGIDIPYFVIPMKMLSHLRSNKLSFEGMELDFEFFKTDPKPFSEYVQFTREQLIRDGKDSIKKLAASNNKKIGNYMANLYVYLIQSPTKKVLGMFTQEGFEEEKISESKSD